MHSWRGSKGELGNVTASLIKNAVDSATQVTNSMCNLGATAIKIEEYLVERLWNTDLMPGDNE